MFHVASQIDLAVAGCVDFSLRFCLAREDDGENQTVNLRFCLTLPRVSRFSTLRC